MELVTIEKHLSKEEYERMTKDDIRRLVRFYSGTLTDIVRKDDEVILIIAAPSTWRYLLLHSLLIPYRYI